MSEAGEKPKDTRTNTFDCEQGRPVSSTELHLVQRGPLLVLGGDRTRQRRHIVKAIAAPLPLGDQREEVLQSARRLQSVGWEIIQFDWGKALRIKLGTKKVDRAVYMSRRGKSAHGAGAEVELKSQSISFRARTAVDR